MTPKNIMPKKEIICKKTYVVGFHLCEMSTIQICGYMGLAVGVEIE
jgi:hypothetical protein